MLLTIYRGYRQLLKQNIGYARVPACFTIRVNAIYPYGKIKQFI